MFLKTDEVEQKVREAIERRFCGQTVICDEVDVVYPVVVKVEVFRGEVQGTATVSVDKIGGMSVDLDLPDNFNEPTIMEMRIGIEEEFRGMEASQIADLMENFLGIDVNCILHESINPSRVDVDDLIDFVNNKCVEDAAEILSENASYEMPEAEDDDIRKLYKEVTE